PIGELTPLVVAQTSSLTTTSHVDDGLTHRRFVEGPQRCLVGRSGRRYGDFRHHRQSGPRARRPSRRGPGAHPPSVGPPASPAAATPPMASPPLPTLSISAEEAGCSVSGRSAQRTVDNLVRPIPF